MGDETRRIILARRAKFVAAALAGLGAATGACESPQPCLSPNYEPREAGPEVPPQPCLTAPYEPPDAGDAGDAGDAADDLDAADAADAPDGD